MRRFINADIISGEISEAITLNRYTYANGNPVSNIDPFGLFGIDIIGDFFQNTIKELENALLFADNFISKSVYGFYPNYNSNYEYNLQYDIEDTLINNQWGIKLKFGDTKASSTGCGPIAVYNAMILLGFEEVSLANTIKTFEISGALTLQTVSNGSLGSNPYAFPDIFKKNNIEYDYISNLENLNDPGIYIIGYWNSSSIISGSHYVAIEVFENGEKSVYNGSWENVENGYFMVGYKVERK